MAVQERLNDRTSSKVEQNRYRTCCNICHIKCGTVFLGTIEAMVSVFVLIKVIQQIIWKKQSPSECTKNFLQDCLIFQFSHFDVTLIFDYIVVLMMIFILSSILLLMCGLLSDTSCLILPHLIVQGLFLLFSLGYFLLHAWSYFYGDLYVLSIPFKVQSLIERMWMAALLVILSAFQCYLFSAVVRCSMYISGIEESRRRRESAFERCSERVRLAKENGLWRTTSWGGGFQQYKGQYDETKPKKPSNKGFRVQWNFSQNTVLEDEEMPLKLSEQTEPENQSFAQSNRKPEPTVKESSSRKITPPSPSHKVVHETYDVTTVDETAKKHKGSEARRNSQPHAHTSTEEVQPILRESKSSHEVVASDRRRNSETKKEQRPANSNRSKDITNYISSQPGPLSQKSYKIEIRKTEHAKEPKPTSSSSPTRKSDRHSEESTHKNQADSQAKLSSQSMQVKSRPSGSRPTLRTYKSVDSEEASEHQSTIKQEPKPSLQRRRSSLSIGDGKPVTTTHHHVRPHRSPDKKHENQLVKKVSITATVHP